MVSRFVFTVISSKGTCNIVYSLLYQQEGKSETAKDNGWKKKKERQKRSKSTVSIYNEREQFLTGSSERIL